MRRGDVYRANLHPRSGSEQRGARPVIVVSHDAFNMTDNWRSVIIVPLSGSGRQATRGPTAVPIAKGSGGLHKDSFGLCHQVTTLDRRKLTQRLGALSSEDLARIDKGMKAALDLS